MRTLAEFIMRGRVHAGLVALLGTLLPFVTPAVVALVTLRKGAVEGTLILFVGLLPAFLTFDTNESQPLVFMFTVLGLITVYVSALVLGRTASWSLTLMTQLACSVAVLFSIQQLAQPSLQHLVDSLTKAMMEQTITAGVDNAPVAIDENTLIGLLAAIIMFSGVCSLLLGRWWQALLYNPGGFGAEFRHFKLGSAAAVICLAISLYFLFQGKDYLIWSFIFSFPLILVTIAIVHAVAGRLKSPNQWLAIFYIAVVFLGFSQLTSVQVVLMGVGFLDNWLDFRSRKSRFT